MSSWLWRGISILGGWGVLVNRSISRTPWHPKKQEGSWVFDGTKTASLCQIWPEKLISLLQVSKKESKLNFWICCFFWHLQNLLFWDGLPTDIMWIFVRQMLFSENTKVPKVDVTWIFPDVQTTRSIGPWFPGSWNPETQVWGVKNDSIWTLGKPTRPAKSFGGSPRGIAYAAYPELQTDPQLVEPPTDLVIYSYKAWDMSSTKQIKIKDDRIRYNKHPYKNCDCHIYLFWDYLIRSHMHFDLRSWHIAGGAPSGLVGIDNIYILYAVHTYIYGFFLYDTQIIRYGPVYYICPTYLTLN